MSVSRGSTVFCLHEVILFIYYIIIFIYPVNSSTKASCARVAVSTDGPATNKRKLLTVHSILRVLGPPGTPRISTGENRGAENNNIYFSITIESVSFVL